MLQKGVGIAVEGDGGVAVAEDLGEGADIHAAFERAGGKGVAQGMKAAVRDMQFFEQQFKTPLVGADEEGAVAVGDDEVAVTALFQAPQAREQLSRQGDDAAGGFGLGVFQHDAVFGVAAGVGDDEQAFFKVDILPAQGEQLTDAQARIEAKQDALHFRLFGGLHGGFDGLLLGGGETADGLFAALGARQAVGRGVGDKPQAAGGGEGVAEHRDHAVDRAGGESAAGLAVAGAKQCGNGLLQLCGRDGFKFGLFQGIGKMQTRDLRIALVGAGVSGGSDIVLQPSGEPCFVFHVFFSFFIVFFMLRFCVFRTGGVAARCLSL